MSERSNSVLTVTRSAPFTVSIAPNGYHVKDNCGYTWAVCRDEAFARIIVEGLYKIGGDQ